MELGAVELVVTAVGSGVTSTVATVAALRVDLKNVKQMVLDLKERLDRVEDLAREARHRVDLLEVRR